jgi:hypothetical protein
VLGPLEEYALKDWPNIVDVSLPFSEDENRPSINNIVFLVILNSG